MNEKFKTLLINNQQEVISLWKKEMKKVKDITYPDITEQLFNLTNDEFISLIKGNLNNENTREGFEKFAKKITSLGWPLSYITDGLGAYRRVAVELIISKNDLEDATYNTKVANYVDDWVASIIRHLVNLYSGNWENIVSLQKIALQELSAPVIPVLDRITIMPLIGTIDTDRAKLIMENLLHGVVEHNTEVMLIDITGVPVVDTMVAHHIIQAAEAVRLLGATCILVGIRPEIAQTIVNLGINLKKFITKSSLRKGFHTALKLTNRKVIQTKKNHKEVDRLIESLSKE